MKYRYFVDFDWANEIDGWRVGRSSELLDVLPKQPIRHVKFSVELANLVLNRSNV